MGWRRLPARGCVQQRRLRGAPPRVVPRWAEEGWGESAAPTARHAAGGARLARRDAGGVPSGDDKQASAAPTPHRSAGCWGGCPTRPTRARAPCRTESSGRGKQERRPLPRLQRNAARRRGPQPPWCCRGPRWGASTPKKTGGHSGGLWGRHPMQWAARGSVKAAASCQAPARCRSRGRRGSGRRCVAFGGGPERAAYEGERRRPATPPRPCRVVAPTLHPVTAAGRGSAEAARRPDGRSLLFCLVDARARLAAAAASPIRLACALRGAARRRDCVRAHPQTPMPCPRQWAEPHALKQGGRAWCAGAASSAVSRGAEPPHPSCGPPNRGGGGPPLPSAARRPRPPACRGGYVRCAGGAPAGRGHQSATSRPAAATVG